MPRKSPRQTLIEGINQCFLFNALDKDDDSSSDSDLESASKSDESSTEELLDLMHLVQSSLTIEQGQRIPKTVAMQNHIFEMADKEFRIAVKVQLLVALERSGFRGCVGFIDGTGIPLHQKPHTMDPETWFCYKKFYSFNAQLVCDDN
ncbi:hypothetical protein HDU81_001361, partial [Chytriomyces hyalinus]